MIYEPAGTCSCHTCNCSGCATCLPFDEAYPHLCPRCQGDGQILTDDPDRPDLGEAWTLCWTCAGNGLRRGTA